jgi:hypothetical protein
LTKSIELNDYDIGTAELAEHSKRIECLTLAMGAFPELTSDKIKPSFKKRFEEYFQGYEPLHLRSSMAGGSRRKTKTARKSRKSRKTRKSRK